MAGKGEADYRNVEKALLRLATGYTVEVRKHHRETVTEYDPQTGKKVRETVTAVPRVDEVYVQPSVTAAVYWLRERVPEGWAREAMERQLVKAVAALLGEAEGAE